MFRRIVSVIVSICLMCCGTMACAEIIGEHNGAPVLDYDGSILVIEGYGMDADEMMEEMSGFSDPERTLAEILSIMSILSDLKYEKEEKIVAGEYIQEWEKIGYEIDVFDGEGTTMFQNEDKIETIEFHYWTLKFSPEVNIELYADLNSEINKDVEKIEDLALYKIELNIIAPKLGKDRPITVTYDL